MLTMGSPALCRSPSRSLLGSSFSTTSLSAFPSHQPLPLQSQNSPLAIQGSSAQPVSIAGGSAQLWPGGSGVLRTSSSKASLANALPPTSSITRHTRVKAATTPRAGVPHVATCDPDPSPFSLNARRHSTAGGSATHPSTGVPHVAPDVPTHFTLKASRHSTAGSICVGGSTSVPSSSMAPVDDSILPAMATTPGPTLLQTLHNSGFPEGANAKKCSGDLQAGIKRRGRMECSNSTGSHSHEGARSPKCAVVSQVEADGVSEIAEQALSIYDLIDASSRGSISKVDLIKSVQRHVSIGDFLLPGVDCSNAASNEQSFNAVNEVFKKISKGGKRITKPEFAVFFMEKAQVKSGQEQRPDAQPTGALTTALRIQLRAAFSLMDSDGDGVISKLDFVGHVFDAPALASLLLPGVVCNAANSSNMFDAVDEVFNNVSSGKRRISFSDLVEHFSTHSAVPSLPRMPVLLRPIQNLQRSSYRVLLISPGFGRKLNPSQCKLVEESGFQVQWLNVPDAEVPGFPMCQHLATVKTAIDQYQPDLLACASKGCHYVMALWDRGLWRGATLMINANPVLKELPKGVPVVIAHGGNDDRYVRTRSDLEQLISTGSPNMCLLYTCIDSGKIGNNLTRAGDQHNMESLQALDCLPRLMDAAVSHAPEMQLMRSWNAMVSVDRLHAEAWLGYSPEGLRRFWASTDRRGMDSKNTFEVPLGSEEFQKVATVFRSHSMETTYYKGTAQHAATWANISITKIERVENGFQQVGSATPYYESLQRAIEDQGLAFEPGLQSRWAFHGTTAIESIVNNPMAGFQPLTSGTRLGTVWGSGTYFARDAKYVLDAGFVNAEADGSGRMLMCLLMTGMSCLGDPQHNGVLPFRQKPHRYNSSVDSLSSPEIFVMQHPGSAYPAYVVTFR